MSDILKRFDELNEEYRNWLRSNEYFSDKLTYLMSIDEEVRGLALIVFKEEDYFVWWYMNAELSELDNKTPYVYAINNETRKIKRILNGFISPPAT